MENCTYREDNKHYFMNSWGSLRYNGYCGLCVCLRTTTPHELNEALKNNECYAEPQLIEQLEYHSNPANFKPRKRF